MKGSPGSRSARGARSERAAPFGQDCPDHGRRGRDRRGNRPQVSRGRRLGVRVRCEPRGRAKRRPRPSGAVFLPLDVTSEESWKAALAAVMERAGRLDILVNNAGINIRKNIEEMPVESFDAMFAVNVRGPFLGIKHALPIMRAAGGGVILNMSSICGLVGHKYTNETYTTTKGALTMLTKSVAVRYAKDNIRCNSDPPQHGGNRLRAGHVQGPRTQGREAGRNSSGKARERDRRGERGGLPGKRRGIVHQRRCASDRRRPHGLLGFAATVGCRRTGASCRNLSTRDGAGKPTLGPLYWTRKGLSHHKHFIQFGFGVDGCELAWRGYACAWTCGSAAAYPGDAAHRALGESFRPDPERRMGWGPSVFSIPNSSS